MRTFFFAFCLFLSANALFGQNQIIEDFYDYYLDNAKASEIDLQGWVLKMAVNHTDDEDASKLLEKITRLRVLIMDEGNAVTKSSYQQFLRDIKSEQFEPLMQVKDGGENVDFLIREEGQKITNLIVLVNSPDDFVMLSLEGNLDFKDLKHLDLDVEGGKQLKKLPGDRKSVPRA